MIELHERKYNCNIEVIVDVIGGKWKMLILWHLKDGLKRFSQLGRLIPGSTQKMLTAQLRELERNGIVARKVYPEVPPKVEYSLTKYGETLKPFIELSCKLGNAHVEFIRSQAARKAVLAPPGLSAGPPQPLERRIVR